MKRSFLKARSMTRVLSNLPEAPDVSESAADKAESTRVTVMAPPIRKSQRPLRRRQGPEWACVEVLKENDEKGPCESTVRCRFCGYDFMADTARIREHVVNGLSGTAMQPASPRAGAPASAEPPPVPVCTFDLVPQSANDRDVALQWLRDYDVLQFCIRVGVAVTPQIAKARRKAEVAESRAVLYPSREHAALAAAAAGEAVAVVTQGAITEWQTTDKLRFIGCGLQDDDCFKIIDLFKRAGSLREMREFTCAENSITDVGFEALCQHVIAPPKGIAFSDTSSVDTQNLLNDDLRAMSRTNSAEQDMGAKGQVEPSLLGARLVEFSTFRNPIGDRGLAALAMALDAGGLPNLKALNLSGTAMVNSDGSPRNMKARERSSVRRARMMKADDGQASPPHRLQPNARDGPVVDVDDMQSGGIGDAGVKEFAYRLHHNKPTPGKPVRAAYHASLALLLRV